MLNPSATRPIHTPHVTGVLRQVQQEDEALEGPPTGSLIALNSLACLSALDGHLSGLVAGTSRQHRVQHHSR